jgi:enoyl-CoA hydratase/carnithine racemase
MQEASQREDAQQQWHHDVVQYKELVEFMLRFPKPIIAAVNGPAVAAGAGLVLASDIVVAASDASLGFPEARRGLVSGLAAPLLVFRCGAGIAARLLLSASSWTAEEAHRAHLFHEVVPNDFVWARAHEIAVECAKSAPESLQLTKRLLNETIGEHLGVTLTAGAAASATARTTEAAGEGLRAFLDRREPNWE